MSEPSRQPKGASSSSELAGMGVQFVVAILLCLFLGKWLDARLGTAPWLLILGVFAGATVSTVAMYRKAFPPERPKSPKPGKARLGWGGVGVLIVVVGGAFLSTPFSEPQDRRAIETSAVIA